MQQKFSLLKPKFSKNKQIQHPLTDSIYTSAARDRYRSTPKNYAQIHRKDSSENNKFERAKIFVKNIFSSEFLRSKRFRYIVLPIIFILIFGGYGYHFIAYSSGSRFTATFKYKDLPVSKSEDFVITKTNNSSGVKISELTAESSISEFVDTTGERVEGEKASGDVTIFNSTTDIIEIPASTAVVCVSSACSQFVFYTAANLNLGPGNSQIVKVTASEVGTEYNLAAGAGQFQVGSYDPNTELVARNIRAFSGGTKKKIIKLVTQADIEKAETQAMEKLKGILLNKIKNDPANKNFTISETSFVSEKVEATPDKKVDDESDIVNVSVKAKGKVNAFDNQQINVIVENLKKQMTPENYILEESKAKNPETKIINQDAESIKINVAVSSIAKPVIDIESIQERLKGHKFDDIDEILKSVPNTTGFTKDYSPQTLPRFFWKIPGDKNRIRIELVREEDNN